MTAKTLEERSPEEEFNAEEKLLFSSADKAYGFKLGIKFIMLSLDLGEVISLEQIDQYIESLKSELQRHEYFRNDPKFQARVRKQFRHFFPTFEEWVDTEILRIKIALKVYDDITVSYTHLTLPTKRIV